MPSSSEARIKYDADGTLFKNSDPEHLELRAVLDEPSAQQLLGAYAKANKSLEIFMCWIDVQEYKSIPTDDYRRSKALHIYHKYVKVDSVLQIGGIKDADVEHYKVQIDLSKNDHSILQTDFYDRIQKICFIEIFYNIFRPFKNTPQYKELKKDLKEKYNHVAIDHFEYVRRLGEGGFGVVVHCVKISTGKHYAMKIQTKRGLLDSFADDPWRVDGEKQAFATCQHPFIVNLDYAFQNEALAIMVLGLGSAGDLQKALIEAPEERLDEQRVQFYVAELVLALAHLHQMGLMYRDLKPSNVLLNDDGHVQLVDLGGVVDSHGKVIGAQHETNSLLPLFNQQYAASASAARAQNQYKEEDHLEDAVEGEEGDELKALNAGEKTPEPTRKRRMSIMGTFGYMAPEMVIMLTQRSRDKVGYSHTVDWWSLGVTMFKLLTGFRPFTEENFSAFMEMAPTLRQNVDNGRTSPEYGILFQIIPFPRTMSENTVDVITRFLDVNEVTRLGAGNTGVSDIKKHPYFADIDWELLEQKHVEPPFKPVTKNCAQNDPHRFPSFDIMLASLGKTQWNVEVPETEEQKYFAAWDYTSPHTLRVEFGIAQEMDQLDRNFKVRQMLGEAHR
eukprot:CAMPEP_0119051758 /NCGR_PEP_ID=MMETSP1177-20130426/73269_1 /TAXON_ID=2985 /ORGANISM="Ochromonas sp, Strain CCMP1899" /LENGTH=615 /DNA_ID=CAMNT_0007031075 /DNA_START=237 /DNA_END=2084 /DNA_ORIENTATION=-